MVLEQQLSIRNLKDANLEILNNPMYKAGSFDGFVFTQIRERDYGYEMSLHGESIATDIPSIWHKLTNFEGALSEDKTRWGVYKADAVLSILASPLPELMVLRKEEILRFLDVVRFYTQADLNNANDLKHFLYYMDFYRKYKEGNLILNSVKNITPHYLAGLFELSPKGTIRFEPAPSGYSGGRLVIQIGVPSLEFVDILKQKYSGQVVEIKSGSSYMWRIRGLKANAFLENVLLPNSVWGEKVLLQKVKRDAETEQ